MAGYPSNLAKTFSPTEQFPQHILPLLPLYNAQWCGYESLTAIVLVLYEIDLSIIVIKVCVNNTLKNSLLTTIFLPPLNMINIPC